MQHIEMCIDEILAEIDARLADTSCLRALAQLDEREANGESMDALDGARFRAHLTAKIAALPLVQARAKIVEARTLLDHSAVATPDAPPAATNVIRLADVGAARQREASKAEPVSVKTAASPRPGPQFKSMRERLAQATGVGITVASIALAGWLAIGPLDVVAHTKRVPVDHPAVPYTMAPVDESAGARWPLWQTAERLVRRLVD
ncbi:MAG: hypothetical protein SFW09_03685 [Hyphomicrobiaceae bacterium]|nr:hypothetical protein [Hyphomicrobiaceae bacterium]